MHSRRFILRTAVLTAISIMPMGASAQVVEGSATTGPDLPFLVILFVVAAGLTALLLRLWAGVMNSMFIHLEPIGSIERRQPYLPSAKVMAGTIVGTMTLLLSSYGTLQNVLPGEGPWQTAMIGIAFTALTLALLLMERHWRGSRDYVFSAIMGTLLAMVLLAFQQALFSGEINANPFFAALAVVCVTAVWRCLFGPWESHVKAAVLGTFIFWIALYLLTNDASPTRLARMLAGVVAIVPALIWATFFLKYQRQQISLVLLMFFAGMLSTAPILFYDKLVRSGAQLQFFFFSVTPENFNRTSSAFVSGNLIGISGVRSTLLTAFISFLLVGCIEEFSKFWVMRRSGKRFFSSIDDAMQLSIIVAIGFAFAENVLNPAYFMSFVRDHLIGNADWGAFMGNVLGRAILTNMVHIVSTGVLGYFFGLALFAGPYLQDAHRKGHIFVFAGGLHALLGFPETAVFRRQMIVMGIIIAVFLHGLFNFLVTFPDILPSNPRSLGDLFGVPENAVLTAIPLLLLPSLFYVVGGFWLLTELFYRTENMKERGHVVTTDTYVAADV